ncbi:hypothetical protein OROGR_007067 [Orobanche gracilis]
MRWGESVTKAVVLRIGEHLRNNNNCLKKKELTPSSLLGIIASSSWILLTPTVTQNKLSGEIPRLLYWNEVLQYLGLRGNNLQGSLSPDMCQLTGLWYFDVRNNSLSGSIPDSIGNCTAFQVLDLSYNNQTGEIPFNIGFLQVATLIFRARLSTSILSSSLQSFRLILDDYDMREPKHGGMRMFVAAKNQVGNKVFFS